MKHYLEFMKIVMVGWALVIVGASCGRGPAGPEGPQGMAGSPGTTITAVQFCQSCVARYPNVFPEIGFCFGGSLYATYSANNGFSSEIVLGTYSSNGVGCSCAFTVGPNCQITN